MIPTRVRGAVIASALLLMLAVMISGCTYQSPPHYAAGYDATTNNATTELYKAVEYGNGVYYLPCYSSAFGYSMSVFVAEHPDLKVTSFSPDDTGSYGRTVGYFVVTEPREK